MTFEQLPLNKKAILIHTENLENRLLEMGINENLEILLEGECICGGTVILNCKFGKFCVRRSEINCDVQLI